MATPYAVVPIPTALVALSHSYTRSSRDATKKVPPAEQPGRERIGKPAGSGRVRRRRQRRAERARDEAMAENVRWILKTEPPGTRVALWAHNGHVARASRLGVEPMGEHLARSLNEDYLALGFAFNQAVFQALDWTEATPVGRARTLRGRPRCARAPRGRLRSHGSADLRAGPAPAARRRPRGELARGTAPDALDRAPVRRSDEPLHEPDRNPDPALRRHGLRGHYQPSPAARQVTRLSARCSGDPGPWGSSERPPRRLGPRLPRGIRRPPPWDMAFAPRRAHNGIGFSKGTCNQVDPGTGKRVILPFPRAVRGRPGPFCRGSRLSWPALPIHEMGPKRFELRRVHACDGSAPLRAPVDPHETAQILDVTP